jgi:dihydropteroate synthase
MRSLMPKFNIESQALHLMGVLNITPDSFSDGGQFFNTNSALEHFQKLIKDRADLIDIGAESTRPNAVLIDESTEWQRLEPVLKALCESENKIPISIDTRKSEIAKKALSYEVSIINDVSGLEDPEMPNVVKDSEALLVINHHRGIPPSIGEVEPNENIIEELILYFEECLKRSIQSGLSKKQIILDPGLGFGKGLRENILILKNLPKLKKYFDLPILVGPSRKRFVKQLWGAEGQDWGSLAVSLLAAANGANIIRCHEPAIYKPIKEFV